MLGEALSTGWNACKWSPELSSRGRAPQRFGVHGHKPSFRAYEEVRGSLDLRAQQRPGIDRAVPV